MAQSRIEAILENILGEENEILDPVSRNEVLLNAIAEQLEGVPNVIISSNEIESIINTIS